MIDVQQIKDHIDCRDLIERDLGRPKTRTGEYTAYKCPLHQEEKGYSLVVYADHWHCFGKCGHGGDAIAWRMEYHGLSFQEACEQLSSGDLPRRIPPQRPLYSLDVADSRRLLLVSKRTFILAEYK